MILNPDEEIVMTSDNKQIILTTKRIIQENKSVVKYINLKDYVGYEIIKKRNNYYLYAIPVCLVISFFVFGIILLVLSALLLISFLAIMEKFLIIIGNQNKIEFLAKGISENSLSKFIQTIESLSKEAKKG
jgi:hypothetical protein